MEKLSLYIHIPFCISKCKYCDFASYANKEYLIEDYFAALKKELIDKSYLALKRNINTIYIGGGTPSCVAPHFIAETLNTINKYYFLTDDTEISIEVNPKTITKEKIKIYKENGINRISIGLQTTNNYLLNKIGRIHTYEDFLESYYTIKNSGINNINLDLMFSLPYQTFDNFKDSLNKVIKLNPNHISLYALIVENNTPIKKEIEENNIILDENLDREMYHYAKDFLHKNNYIQYEISNFARKDYECKHNLLCWDFEEYLGFGSSAHSFWENKRLANPLLIEEYILMIKENKNSEIIEILSEQDKLEEYIMLALRKTKGININIFKEKFTFDFVRQYANILNELKKENLIDINDTHVFLTNKGQDFANSVIISFMK